MSYVLKETPEGIEVEVTSDGRDALVRESLCAALDAVYGPNVPVGSEPGQMIPIQAAGKDLARALPELLRTLFDTVARSERALRPPRWLAFDEGRITATLPLSDVSLPGRLLHLERAIVDPAGRAQLVLAVRPANGAKGK